MKLRWGQLKALIRESWDDAFAREGFWGRFEADNGDYLWLAKRYFDEGNPWKIVEDPELATCFGDEDEAWEAVNAAGPMQGGQWNVVSEPDAPTRRETLKHFN